MRGPLNIGRGAGVSILDLAGAVARACDCELRVRHDPPRPGDVRDSLADVSRAQAQLGWSATRSLDVGIEATVAAFTPTASSTSRAQTRR